MCMQCITIKQKNCANCLHDCKMPDVSADWHCGAWKPQPPSQEEVQKMHDFMEQLWEEEFGNK